MYLLNDPRRRYVPTKCGKTNVLTSKAKVFPFNLNKKGIKRIETNLDQGFSEKKQHSSMLCLSSVK
jgi:hypothetical protein